MRKLMAMLSGISALALVAGCTIGDAGYAGPKRGIQGSLTTKYFDFRGVNTTLLEGELALQATINPDGTRADMVSTYTNPITGVTASGFAAVYAAKGDMCIKAPNMVECGGKAPPAPR